MPTLNSPPGHPAPELLRIYPPGETSATCVVHSLGSREWMGGGLVDSPRGCDDWLLMLFHQEVLLGIDGQLTRSGGPTLILWQPRTGNHYGDPAAAWCHSWLHIAGSAAEQQIRLAGLPLDRPISGIDPVEFERHLHDIAGEMAARRPDPEILECTLRILLRQLRRRIVGDDLAVPAGLLAVRRHLSEHFAEQISLTQLARIAGLSRNHCCTAFKRAFGLSPYEFTIRLRLERARSLLRGQGITVAEAARAVGYDRPASFARLVQRHAGHGPSRWR